MIRSSRKALLSRPRRRLVELMQEVNFGSIEGLLVCGGEPVLEPPPTVLRVVRLGGGDNAPRTEREMDDFALEGRVVELFEHFDRLGNGMVEVLEVRHGLPFRMNVKETVRA